MFEPRLRGLGKEAGGFRSSDANLLSSTLCSAGDRCGTGGLPAVVAPLLQVRQEVIDLAEGGAKVVGDLLCEHVGLGEAG